MNDFDNMTMLEAALTYAKMGYAVFPLREFTKKPDSKFVPHGCLDATKNEELIRKWWSQHPNDNIAIATGDISMGLLPIDSDMKHGKNGEAIIRNWEREYNIKLPDTVTCITPTGGYHYWYYDDNVSEYKTKSDVYEGVDIRANGGYVLVPPSVLPEGKYIWDVCGTLGEVPIPRNSETVREFIKPAKRFKPEKNDDNSKADDKKMPERFPEGERTQNLISLIGFLKDKGLTDDAIKACITVENAKRCDPPLTDTELKQEIFPALSRDWIPGHPYTNIKYMMLPEPIQLNYIWGNPPMLAPELINGVLRQGHKLILSAPSKAGKSFALIQLAMAITEGMNWFGCKCRKGRVLYINMEIDPESFFNRIKKVYDAYGLTEDVHVEDFAVWNLRGNQMTLSQLAPLIIEKAGHDYNAVIIDPLYKVMEGDENSNSDVGRMVGHFDRIAKETGASVIYAHHFAKGSGGDRNTIDRGAGAGTFARDPDAILTMTQLDMSDEVNEIHTAWRMEFVLREFPNKKPVNVWYEFPIHRIDKTLDCAVVETSASRNAKAKAIKSAETKKRQIENVRNAVTQIINEDGKFLLSDFKKAYEEYEILSSRTIKRRLEEAGYEAEKPVKNGFPAYWKTAI